jgi:hypothetical protein
MNLLAGRVWLNDLLKERYKLLTRMPRCGLAVHLSCFGVECGIQRKRTVPVVLEAMAFGPSGAQWQNWI